MADSVTGATWNLKWFGVLCIPEQEYEAYANIFGKEYGASVINTDPNQSAKPLNLIKASCILLYSVSKVLKTDCEDPDQTERMRRLICHRCPHMPLSPLSAHAPQILSRVSKTN